jgi:glycosyltransferase involved in cell wall biosynthesis
MEESPPAKSPPAKTRSVTDGDRRRLRVVMVIQRFRPYFSGQGVQLEELSRALVRRGAEVTVVAARRGRDAPREERSHGVSIRRLRCDLPGRGDSRLRRRLWSPTFALRTFLHLLAGAAPIDLIHVHGANDALYAAWAFGRLRRVPVLFEMTLMGVDDPPSIRDSRKWFAGLRYAAYRRFTGYVAMSPALAEAYREAGLPEHRLRTIPQGVDVARYRPAHDRAALRDELGAADDEPVLIFVGSLVGRKGIDLLLAAWAQIHRARPSARLWLVGRDRFEDDLDAERFLRGCLAKLSPSALGRIRRLGVRDDVHRFLQAADLFLFPSRREGFGTAIIEAMGCGVPCIVGELPGITDFIFAGVAPDAACPDGVVVPQENPTALADAALTLLSAPDRAVAIGASGRKRVLQQFDIERVTERYLSWYAELLAP